MDKKLSASLTAIATIIGVVATAASIIPIVTDLAPDEPAGPFYGLDTSQEIFDHSTTPGQIRFHLIHNGTDVFYVDTINIRTKEFHNIECSTGGHTEQPQSAGMFDILAIPSTGVSERRDNFVTINGDIQLGLLYEEGKTGQLVIDYVTIGPYSGEPYAFWQDMVIGYHEMDDPEIKYARYHAHDRQNPAECSR